MSLDASLAESLSAVREASPLVHCITNDVTVSQVANVVLHWGGLPVMADDVREVAEMAAGADALLLNMGTVSEAGERAMLEAGRAAADAGVPVVLDPVGAGATDVRTEVATRLCRELDLAVVNGNYGEVSTLAGVGGEVRGVESVGEYDDIAAAARDLAAETGATVLASGEADVIADADAAYAVSGGDPLLGEVVGTGCMLGATAAAFCGGVGDPLRASAAAAVGFGVAAERAAATDPGGPGSFETALRDAVAGLAPEEIDDGALAERVERA